MNQPKELRDYLGSYLMGLAFIIAIAGRILQHNYDRFNLLVYLGSLASFTLFYALEPLLLHRTRWYRFLYFPAATILAVVLGQAPDLADVTAPILVMPAVQAVRTLSRRAATLWVVLYTAILIVISYLGMELVFGVVLLLLIIAGGALLIAYDVSYARAKAQQAESQALLIELQSTHQKLQEHAAQAEELVAARERNRLARELHDSVSQQIFAITLTTRAAQILLEKNPERVTEQVDRLQDMTTSALSQLRSLITQMRPEQKS